MTTATIPFDPAEFLTDEESIAEFLNASAELGDPAVLMSAIAVAAKARTMTDLAAKAGLGRESLYKALAPGAHPRYETVFKLITAMGVTIRFEALPAKRPHKAAATRRGRTTSKTQPV